MFSIYVPRVLNEHTVQSVTNVMAHFNIGIVQYVDFTPINKKPGFYETFDAKYKSAFIHFVEVPGYQINTQFWTLIQEQEQGCKFTISPNEYWICLKNHTPIQRTMMNIHQVVENGRYLEDRIKTLEDTNKLLQDNNKLLQDNYKTLEDNNKLLQHNYKTLEDKLAQLQDRFDNFVNPTCDTWNTDTPMTINDLKTQDNNKTTSASKQKQILSLVKQTQVDVTDIKKSIDGIETSVKQKMSNKDILRYYKYEHNWAYDEALDR
jgi:hypothetical protein